MPLTQAPVVRAEMLIRTPAADVYAAFVDPAITTRFWFTRASGPLVAGQSVTWHWDQYGVEAPVQVEALEPGRRIRLHWPDPVEWQFSARGDHATQVTITATGFAPDDNGVAQAIDQMGGYMLVLAGCKAWLEHGIALNLVGDKNPDAHVTPALASNAPLPWVASIDHLVLTVRSIPNSIAFYQRVLGMAAKEFKPGRFALHFGQQKINLHQVGVVVDPNVKHATPGSADLCFRTHIPLAAVIGHLQRQQVAIVQGPVPATGARRLLQSVYFYDPDENLIEISNEVDGTRMRADSCDPLSA